MIVVSSIRTYLTQGKNAIVILTNAHVCMDGRHRMGSELADDTADEKADDKAQVHEHPGAAALPRVRLEDYSPAGDLLRALAAPIRLAIIDLLTGADRCVHELVDAVGVTQPLVSQHLKTLRAAGLVTTRRRGREVVYQLADEHVVTIVRDTLAHAQEDRPGAVTAGPDPG